MPWVVFRQQELGSKVNGGEKSLCLRLGTQRTYVRESEKTVVAMAQLWRKPSPIVKKIEGQLSYPGTEGDGKYKA